MKVRLQEIDEKPSQFSFRIQRKDLEKLEARFDCEAIEWHAQLTASHEYVELKATYQGRIKTMCDRCLEPVTIDLKQDFELALVSAEHQASVTGDFELSMDSPDRDYFQGEEIDLLHYFEDQLILDLPFAISCFEECKGLCPTCGGNRNHNQCECHKSEGNNPFAGLRDLKFDS